MLSGEIKPVSRSPISEQGAIGMVVIAGHGGEGHVQAYTHAVDGVAEC